MWCSLTSITLESMLILPRRAILVVSVAMVASKVVSTSSESKFGLRFEISNLNYPGIDVHVASNSHFGGL